LPARPYDGPVTQWTDGDPQARLLALARPAVAAVGPEELPLLEATVAATRRPWARRRPGRSEDVLGFGWDESVPMVTMAALGAAQAVLVYLASLAGDVLREETSGAIRHRLRALLRRRAPRWAARSLVIDVPLEPEQLRRVREIAVDTASDLGLDRASAELVADAIVGRLAVTEPDEV
jgi:hypothetical protein